MSCVNLYVCSYVVVSILLLFVVEATNRQWYTSFGEKKSSSSTLIVDKSGKGNFSSIQSAINYVPSDNKNWITIKIKAGTYREKIKIPHNKPYIILKGEKKKETKVIWDDHYTVAQSPTFTSIADNIIVKSMSFVNSYNNPVNKNPRLPAVAAMITGDKSLFYKCGFYGLQDTLWDDQGRHYYKHCTIQGAVDFIFGGGQTIFDGCDVTVLGGALEEGVPGFITAQGRTNPNDENGFVFKECNVYGSGITFLGRPWRGYSRVFFYNSYLSNVVVPQGWTAWNFAGHEGQLTFAEYGCYGPGSDTTHRVKWEKKLSFDTMEQLTSMNFIDSDGWVQNQSS